MRRICDIVPLFLSVFQSHFRDGLLPNLKCGISRRACPEVGRSAMHGLEFIIEFFCSRNGHILIPTAGTHNPLYHISAILAYKCRPSTGKSDIEKLWVEAYRHRLFRNHHGPRDIGMGNKGIDIGRFGFL